MKVTAAGRRPSAETYPPTASGSLPPNSIFIGDVDLVPAEVERSIAVSAYGSVDDLADAVAGDVAFIRAGEPHWHGAAPGADMTHWSITGQSKTTIIVE